MIPWLLDVRVQRTPQRVLRLWLPLFLVWLLLLPIALLLLPLFVFGCLVLRLNPARVLVNFWHVLTGFPGTRIEYQHGLSTLRIRIT
jgi:hypothetical protein